MPELVSLHLARSSFASDELKGLSKRIEYLLLFEATVTDAGIVHLRILKT